MAGLHDAAKHEKIREDLSVLSSHSINQEYFRRNYPRGFRFVFDLLLINFLRENPLRDKYAFAAEVLEEVQRRHQRELDLRPDWPYFYKLLMRVDRSRVPPKPRDARPSRLWPDPEWYCSCPPDSCCSPIDAGSSTQYTCPECSAQPTCPESSAQPTCPECSAQPTCPKCSAQPTCPLCSA